MSRYSNVCTCGHRFFTQIAITLRCPDCGAMVALEGAEVVPFKKPEAIASNHWIPLHLYAPNHKDNWNPLVAMKWYLNWSELIPNMGCGCRDNWRAHGLIPDFSSPRAFAVWAWKAHNFVSRTINKPILDSYCDCERLYGPAN